MNVLYPPVEPRAAFHLDVGEGHRLWVEDCGPEGGLPAVFLHGGPGSGCKAYHRQFFHPTRWRAVLFDQRGAGRSTPRGCIEANDLSRLVADVERIREHLGVERWVVFGGSWGATLALAYARALPERVRALVLRGAFLARDEDLRWFFTDGANRIFPEDWARLTASVPEDERPDLFNALHQRLFRGSPEERRAAARAWSRWAGRIATHTIAPEPPAEVAAGDDAGDRLVEDVRIEMHYAAHRYFLRADPLLADPSRYPRVPTFIVHGRRDLTCLPEAAHALALALPHAELRMLPEAGHLASEPSMIDALVGILDALSLHLGKRPDTAGA